RFFDDLLRIERVRHALVEEQTARLQQLRFSEDLDRADAAMEELRAWASQLQEAVDFHSDAGRKLGEALEAAAGRERALADERDALRAQLQALRSRGLMRFRRARSSRSR